MLLPFVVALFIVYLLRPLVNTLTTPFGKVRRRFRLPSAPNWRAPSSVWIQWCYLRATAGGARRRFVPPTAHLSSHGASSLRRDEKLLYPALLAVVATTMLEVGGVDVSELRRALGN